MSRHEQILRNRGGAERTGRALVPASVGPSLLGRLMAGLGLRRRASLRLLAVPRDPVVGDKAAGAALLKGRLTTGTQDLAIADLDLAGGALPLQAAERVHSFAWLRDLAAASTHERGSPMAEALTRRWLDHYENPAAVDAWRADLAGRRLLFWIAYAPYVLTTREPGYRARFLAALAKSAGHAARTGDRAAPGLARITAWAGATAASLMLQGGPVRTDRAAAGLARALTSGLHDDGGLISRAPYEQLELVELLALLRATFHAARQDQPEWLIEADEGALSALLCVTLGDAGLSAWQGGNGGDPHRLVAAVEAAAASSRPLRQARGWGYQRLQARDALLIMDAGPPPPPEALSGGCASTLAFELSDGTQRLVVNCGGPGAARGVLPDELTHLLRSTAAHSTLSLGDTNSTAILDGGKLGKGVTRVDMERGTIDDHQRVEASHDGYVRRFGIAHRRELILAVDGRQLSGQDMLVAEGRKRSREPIPFVLRFHLAPEVEVTATADGRGALLRLPQKRAWQFRCRGGALSVEESLWLSGDGMPRATSQLVVSGETPAEGMTIGWEFKRVER
jgi:uncharacterized heparinase superfamily protein